MDSKQEQKCTKIHRCTSRCDANDDHTETQHLLNNTRLNYGSGDKQKSFNDNVTHCHDHIVAQDRLDRHARKKLIIASILCLTFMVIELVGGVMARSLAIATDAAHLLTDFASFMISLFALYIAAKPATKNMSFGWYRAEVVGALISVLLIWVVTGVLVYMAVQRVITGDYEINATIMLITAAAGVGFNIIMGVSLHDAHHGHSHSASTDHDDEDSGEEHKPVNINVRAAFIHVVGDLIQSIGVLVAAFLIYYKPEWKIADPICTFLFSVLVLFTTINILRDAMHVLMEGTPKGLKFNIVKESLLNIHGVKEVHNLRLWSLTLSKTAISVHLALDPSTNQQDVLATAGRMLRDRYDIYECTIQIEAYCPSMQDCDDCQDPKD